MHKLIVTLIMFVFIAGCGGGGSDTLVEDNELAPSRLFNDPIVQQARTYDVQNIMGELDSLSKSNFVAVHKKMHKLQLSGFPDLNTTFDLHSSSIRSKGKKDSSTQIYKNQWSEKNEYLCTQGGTASKEVKLTPRGHLDADTYMTGDDTKYQYNQCDRGSEIYDGSVTYHANDFTKFDYRFGAIPLGTFVSRFNHMSTETDTQKTTLNGTIKFTSEAQYKPEPDGSLISLETKYETVGDFAVSVYDKSTGETIKLTYNGTLENIKYYKSRSSDSATSVSVSLDSFKYRKTTDYLLNIENEKEIITVAMYDNIPAIVDENGNILKRPVGYDYDNLSAMNVSLDRIFHMTLADGRSRYIFDKDSDSFPDADITEGEVQHVLPANNLMDGVVVIGFDTCFPTTLLRQYLDELGMPYTYVNIENTQEEHDVFEWFNISGVPYVGMKGNYFGAAGYSKGGISLFLNVYGFDMDDAYVKENRVQSAAIYHQERFDDLQTKNTHRAMAVAYDLPFQLNTYRTWNQNSAEKAKEVALEKCEVRRKARVDNNKTEIKSHCKIYSVDGVKEPEFIR